MRDFTIDAYRQLVSAFQSSYHFHRVDEFLANEPTDRIVMFRHDVDRNPAAAVRCAEILAEMGGRGTFYFRHPKTFRPSVFRRTTALGHEVGYHYEVLSKTRGDVRRALELFTDELGQFRNSCEVRTACMHGSPLSPWDNRAIWGDAKLADFDLIGEPYLSIDFSRVQYLTDTGRRWDGFHYSVRDRVQSRPHARIRTSEELAAAARTRQLSSQVMLTIHPERWSDSFGEWAWQFAFQKAKNVAKRALIMTRERRQRR